MFVPTIYALCRLYVFECLQSYVYILYVARPGSRYMAKFWDFDTVTFSFLFEKYCLIMN